jgi:hypothetical protein
VINKTGTYNEELVDKGTDGDGQEGQRGKNRK